MSRRLQNASRQNRLFGASLEKATVRNANLYCSGAEVAICIFPETLWTRAYVVTSGLVRLRWLWIQRCVGMISNHGLSYHL